MPLYWKIIHLIKVLIYEHNILTLFKTIEYFLYCQANKQSNLE